MVPHQYEWMTAQTQSVAVDGTRFTYRRLGPDTGTPVVLLNHRGANLDDIDPPIVTGLAQGRPVHALNYRGIGPWGARRQGPLPTWRAT